MLSLFPRDVFDEACDLIESVSEGFLAYFCLQAGTRTIMKVTLCSLYFFLFYEIPSTICYISFVMTEIPEIFIIFSIITFFYDDPSLAFR